VTQRRVRHRATDAAAGQAARQARLRQLTRHAAPLVAAASAGLSACACIVGGRWLLAKDGSPTPRRYGRVSIRQSTTIDSSALLYNLSLLFLNLCSYVTK
jgi:hypothetical protein